MAKRCPSYQRMHLHLQAGPDFPEDGCCERDTGAGQRTRRPIHLLGRGGRITIALQSAQDHGTEFPIVGSVPITYCVDSEQNIALARKQKPSRTPMAITSPSSTTMEYPIPNWLPDPCSRHAANIRFDGLFLGPVENQILRCNHQTGGGQRKIPRAAERTPRAS